MCGRRLEETNPDQFSRASMKTTTPMSNMYKHMVCAHQPRPIYTFDHASLYPQFFPFTEAYVFPFGSSLCPFAYTALLTVSLTRISHR